MRIIDVPPLASVPDGEVIVLSSREVDDINRIFKDLIAENKTLMATRVPRTVVQPTKAKEHALAYDMTRDGKVMIVTYPSGDQEFYNAAFLDRLFDAMHVEREKRGF